MWAALARCRPRPTVRFVDVGHVAAEDDVVSDSNGGAERRRWKRLGRELRLELYVLDDGASSEHGIGTHAVGTHFNPAGIFVELPEPPPIGARVRVTLLAEGNSGLLTASGQVVSRVEPDSGSPPGCGLALESTGAAWQKLYKWLTASTDS